MIFIYTEQLLILLLSLLLIVLLCNFRLVFQICFLTILFRIGSKWKSLRSTLLEHLFSYRIQIIYSMVMHWVQSIIATCFTTTSLTHAKNGVLCMDAYHRRRSQRRWGLRSFHIHALIPLRLICIYRWLLIHAVSVSPLWIGRILLIFQPHCRRFLS